MIVIEFQRANAVKTSFFFFLPFFFFWFFFQQNQSLRLDVRVERVPQFLFCVTRTHIPFVLIRVYRDEEVSAFREVCQVAFNVPFVDGATAIYILFVYDIDKCSTSDIRTTFDLRKKSGCSVVLDKSLLFS